MADVLQVVSVSQPAASPSVGRLRLINRGTQRSSVRAVETPPLRVREPANAATSHGKKWFDRTCASVGLLALLPVFLLIALAIRVQSNGPALYRQQRIGLSGTPFTIWKFRTMTADSDRHLHGLLHHHGRGQSPLFKVPDDPRVTGLGKYLRRYSIDELPQLINVALGHMSLVGPRPQRADEVALYTPGQADRLRVRPGLTGLWQVEGRSALGWDDAVRLDLEYVETWSPRLDAQILSRTAAVVLQGQGAV